MILLTMGFKSLHQPVNCQNHIKNDYISLSNLHTTLPVRIVFYAAPRCKLSQSTSQGGKSVEEEF